MHIASSETIFTCLYLDIVLFCRHQDEMSQGSSETLLVGTTQLAIGFTSYGDALQGSELRCGTIQEPERPPCNENQWLLGCIGA